MKHVKNLRRDMEHTERYQDALESYKEERWAEVAAMQPEAIAALLVQKLGKEKFIDLVGTFLFDPLAEYEFDSSLEPEPIDECEPAFEGGAA